MHTSEFEDDWSKKVQVGHRINIPDAQKVPDEQSKVLPDAQSRNWPDKPSDIVPDDEISILPEKQTRKPPDEPFRVVPEKQSRNVPDEQTTKQPDVKFDEKHETEDVSGKKIIYFSPSQQTEYELMPFLSNRTVEHPCLLNAKGDFKKF